ncbi:hypothetical protein ES703_87202 [subsurface metagenome]
MIDVLFNSLDQQIFKDFELILIDELERRNSLISEYIKNFNFQLKILRPKNTTAKFRACCHYNQGIIEADGELIILIDDGTWVDWACLNRHWGHYIGHDKKISLIGMTHEISYPILRESFHNAWISIFKDEFESLSNLPITRCDDKPIFHEDSGRWFCGNCSIPLNVLLDLNGYDEQYSNAPSSHDIDLGMRAEFYGWKFEMDEDCLNYRFNHRDIYKESYEPNWIDNYHLFVTKFKLMQIHKTSLRANNKYNLREERGKLGK